VRTVAIIDDEPNIRWTLGEFLRREGYEVLTAEDYQGGLSAITEHPVDVAIVDVILPKVSGIELLKEIRKNQEYIPVVMITGEPNFSTVSEIVRIGAYDYIIKPVVKEQLLHVVRRAVEKRELVAGKQRLQQKLHEHALNLEQEVSRRTRELESTLKKLASNEQAASLGRMAAQIAHEVKNPLGGLRLYALHLKSKVNGKLEAKEAELLDKICEIIEHLIEVVERILDFTRPISLERKPMDINQMLEDLLLLIEDRISLKHITVTKELAPSLPQCLIDGPSMASALLNLLINAIEALSDRGSLVVRTARALYSDTDRGAVEVEIADTGCGMSKEQLEKIFEPFYTTKAKRPGTRHGSGPQSH